MSDETIKIINGLATLVGALLIKKLLYLLNQWRRNDLDAIRLQLLQVIGRKYVFQVTELNKNEEDRKR